MSVYVNTEYNGFMATVTVESDEIDRIDLKAKDFRIDVTDVVEQSARAAEYQIALEELDRNKEHYNETMSTVLSNLNRAIANLKLNIQLSNGDVYSDKETAERVLVRLESIRDKIEDYSDIDNVPSSIQLNKNLDETNSHSWQAFFKEQYDSAKSKSFNVERVKHTYIEQPEKLVKRKKETRWDDGTKRTYYEYDRIPDGDPITHVYYYTRSYRTEDKDDSNILVYEPGKCTDDVIEEYRKKYAITDGKDPTKESFEKETYTTIPIKTDLGSLCIDGTETMCLLNEAREYAKKIDIKYDNTPMLSIYNANPDKVPVDNHVATDVFCNADYETLLMQGMQYWVHENGKILIFRFIPQMRAAYKFQAVHVVVALDYNNVANFDISLLPRLVTGDIVRQQDDSDHPGPIGSVTIDPQIDLARNGDLVEDSEGVLTSAVRTDYIFNTYEQDNNHLYVNNAVGTSGQVPVYIVKSSAYISKEMSQGTPITQDDGTTGTSADYNFMLKKTRSYLYDNLAASAIELPWSIRPFGQAAWCNDKEEYKDYKPGEVEIELVPGYQNSAYAEDWMKTETTRMTFDDLNKLTVLGYEICQTISASATDANKQIFAKNQVYLSMEV